MSKRDIYRILDAAANRGREALRVIEDAARFLDDNQDLAAALKSTRHRFAAAAEQLDRRERLLARDTVGDVGTALETDDEYQRATLLDVLTANFARLQESARSLEEFSKIVAPQLAREWERVRYDSYTLEKAAFESAVRFDAENDDRKEREQSVPQARDDDAIDPNDAQETSSKQIDDAPKEFVREELAQEAFRQDEQEQDANEQDADEQNENAEQDANDQTAQESETFAETSPAAEAFENASPEEQKAMIRQALREQALREELALREQTQRGEAEQRDQALREEEQTDVSQGVLPFGFSQPQTIRELRKKRLNSAAFNLYVNGSISDAEADALFGANVDMFQICFDPDARGETESEEQIADVQRFLSRYVETFFRDDVSFMRKPLMLSRGFTIWGDAFDGGIVEEQSDWEEVRNQIGDDYLVGATASNIDEVAAAFEAGQTGLIDFVEVGPVFKSDGVHEATGPGFLRAIMDAVEGRPPIPVFAFGGIDEHNCLEIFDAGIERIGVGSAVLNAPDMRSAALKLSSLF